MAACLLLAACSASPVPVVPAERAGDPRCAQVAAKWPVRVAGHDRVPTSADSPAVAAWGDPPVVARCGLTSPGPTQLDCISADGVDWVATPMSDGIAFTTYGRDPALEVLVPRAYAPEPLVLAPFADAAEAVPQGPHRCR